MGFIVYPAPAQGDYKFFLLFLMLSLFFSCVVIILSCYCLQGSCFKNGAVPDISSTVLTFRRAIGIFVVSEFTRQTRKDETSQEKKDKDNARQDETR
jgi:hypothetical protein